MRTPAHRLLPSLLLAIAAATFPACASFQHGPLYDGDEAKATRLDDLAGQGFCQLFLVAGTGFRQEPYALVYNTTGLNGAAETRQSCPPERWAKVDGKAVRDRYHVPGAVKEAGRTWTLDWLELPIGARRDFDGVAAAWFGLLWIPEDFEKTGVKPYQGTDDERAVRQGWRKGTQVYVLDDPRGTQWVMQSFSNGFDPTITAEGLAGLGERLRLPAGWKFRTRVLEEDLELTALNGRIRVLQDNLRNSYAGCFTLSGQKSCNFQP